MSAITNHTFFAIRPAVMVFGLSLLLFYSMPVVDALTTEQVIQEVESVFGISDGGTLQSHEDSVGDVLKLLKPITDSFSRVGCPLNFSVPEAWPEANRSVFKVCLYAVVGNLVTSATKFSEGDFQEHSQCKFVLDIWTGSLVNGNAALEITGDGQLITTSNTTMSVLVVVLVVSMGFMLYLKGDKKPNMHLA